MASTLATLPGLSLPELSEYDPGREGEGSIDPMGVASISDRLADRLVPGIRARMRRIRFVTATAVGAVACETLADELPADGRSTPAICFEWLVIESFVNRLSPSQISLGVPGSQKARAVANRGQRLSAETYLKGPSVFGFNGVYKTFSVDSGVVSSDLTPGLRCADLTRAWEQEQGFVGFTDAVSGTDGGRLHANIRDQVRNALREGHSTTNPRSSLFGYLARSLPPDNAGKTERAVLRSLIMDRTHETRAELARHIADIDPTNLSEAALLDAVRPMCSPTLRRIIDAVIAYERFAILVDAAFRTLCSVSYGTGTVTPYTFVNNQTIISCAAELPGRFSSAADAMAEIDFSGGFEERLGEFAIRRNPTELVELVMEHHERIQSDKPPAGKRSWFESLPGGWVVRSQYGTPLPPEIDGDFIHPIRVAALRGFLRDSAR